MPNLVNYLKKEDYNTRTSPKDRFPPLVRNIELKDDENLLELLNDNATEWCGQNSIIAISQEMYNELYNHCEYMIQKTELGTQFNFRNNVIICCDKKDGNIIVTKYVGNKCTYTEADPHTDMPLIMISRKNDKNKAVTKR
jgi:hypothetical protein